MYYYFGATPPPRRPAPALVACRCHPPCSPFPVCPHLPLLASPSLAPLSALAHVTLPPLPPPSTRTAIPDVDNHHRRCHSAGNNDRQMPEVGAHHRCQQWRSSSTAAVIDGCGSNGVFAAIVVVRRWLHSTAFFVDDKVCHRRLRHRPPPKSTMTAISAVNNDNQHRRPYPVEDNANGPRLANDRPSGKVKIAANVCQALLKMVSRHAWSPGIYQALR